MSATQYRLHPQTCPSHNSCGYLWNYNCTFCDFATSQHSSVSCKRRTRSVPRRPSSSSPIQTHGIASKVIGWNLAPIRVTGVHDLDFLQCIQRLHVAFESLIEADWTDKSTHNFWKRVQRRFPQAKHVMLGDESRNISEYSAGESTASWPPPKLHRRMCQLCPSDINVSVSILRLEDRWKRNLWRRGVAQEDDKETQELYKCKTHPGPSIIVPHNPFHGRVGTCQYVWSRGWAIRSEERALRVFRLAATERHHFHERHEAFGCPDPDCDAWFEQPEEYTTHISKPGVNRHDESYDLPEPYQSLFADAEKRLEPILQRHREAIESFLQWWGKHGSEQREVAEKEFLREVEHMYNIRHVQGEPLAKQRWLMFMKNWFD